MEFVIRSLVDPYYLSLQVRSTGMARLLPGLVGGVLLASMTFAVDPTVDPALDPEVTITLAPPTVVQPFDGVASAAAQADEVPPALIQPADQQKLPPGPPSRVP